ncbi:hypothetical protein N656DRAFT_150086 [Canariomyces notabilis]|uniref:Uncharacterized protein n=1 Tax=Canariomyces notabilis TaxID=2074819 RepID=A0AAN6TCB8_9PEZI|nr:hypothetical protein N656DRAFT_150086 [Canariomyces arenarius]
MYVHSSVGIDSGVRAMEDLNLNRRVKRAESLESLVLRLNGTSQRRVVVVAVGMTTLVAFVAEKPFNVSRHGHSPDMVLRASYIMHRGPARAFLLLLA